MRLTQLHWNAGGEVRSNYIRSEHLWQSRFTLHCKHMRLYNDTRCVSHVRKGVEKICVADLRILSPVSPEMNKTALQDLRAAGLRTGFPYEDQVQWPQKCTILSELHGVRIFSPETLILRNQRRAWSV
jgi:hypothetical protein